MSLLVAPVFDDVTVYSSKWAEHIKQLLINPTVIEGRPVSRKEVEAALIGKSMLLFYDHGNESGLYGSNNEQVITKENIALLPPEVYTMACLTAKSCGIEIWKAGKLFWGYYDVFSFTTDALDEFEQMANNGIIQVTNGKTWSEAYISTQTLGIVLSKALADNGNYIAAVAMDSDAKALRLYDSTRSPPESSCKFRNTAIKLFGEKAWYISKLRAISTLIFGTATVYTVYEYYVFNHALSDIGILTMVIMFLVGWYDHLESGRVTK